MNVWIIVIVGICYLALLFGIASFTERRRKNNKWAFSNPYIYALSMGVYCTAWTYYGSVGRAAVSGIDFVTIYLGPTIMAGLFIPILGKIIHISKVLHLTSLADFISVRYGKNFTLGILVSLFCVIGVIPYISLQIKAVVDSIGVFSAANNNGGTTQSLIPIAIISTSVLCFFTILYGARNIDATEKHQGLVTVIAFESIIKLVAFLAVGIYVTYGLFDGFQDIFNRITDQSDYKHLTTLNDQLSYPAWTGMIILSMFAILFLPRQFHISVVENANINHVKTASWLFPLYLFLINIFVLPIAMAGVLLLEGSGTPADNYVLALPLTEHANGLAILTWIGGFSAATGMIIVETIALSIMVCNNLVMPLLFSSTLNNVQQSTTIQKSVLPIRRLSIVLVLTLALLYYLFVSQDVSLVSIGLVSFCAVTQFAPATIGGLFWKKGSQKGALTGLVAGMFIWFFTLIVPNLSAHKILSESIITEGLFGMSWLHPYHLFGLTSLDHITHSLFWSLSLNLFLYIIVSLNTSKSSQEVYQAELFVNIFKHNGLQENRTIWKGTAYIKDLEQLLNNFLGTERAQKLLQSYASRNKININATDSVADGRMVAFTERILGGIIGTSSARILMRNATKEEDISIDEVLKILWENQQVMEVNKELRKKSQELSNATKLLQEANKQLRHADEQKDEFLYTVTHELRTPMTSIRALSEIVYDNPDLEEEQKQMYLGAIIKETERLSHLISQVLILEKFESGKQRLNITIVNINELIHNVTESFSALIKEKKLQLELQITNSMILIPCDRDLVAQVLVNLTGNAIKFAETTIKVHTHFDENEWQVWVSDDGPGVPADEQQLIFDKFFQAKNQTLKKPEGSGLGLAICKKIVELHSGKIWIAKREQKGAHFVFTLPVEIPLE